MAMALRNGASGLVHQLLPAASWAAQTIGAELQQGLRHKGKSLSSVQAVSRGRRPGCRHTSPRQRCRRCQAAARSPSHSGQQQSPQPTNDFIHRSALIATHQRRSKDAGRFATATAASPQDRCCWHLLRWSRVVDRDGTATRFVQRTPVCLVILSPSSVLLPPPSLMRPQGLGRISSSSSAAWRRCRTASRQPHS